MILSNKGKTRTLCNTKVVGIHMSKICVGRSVAVARCWGVWGHGPPKNFNVIFSTSNAHSLLLETTVNQLNLRYFYINVRSLYTTIHTRMILVSLKKTILVKNEEISCQRHGPLGVRPSYLLYCFARVCVSPAFCARI